MPPSQPTARFEPLEKHAHALSPVARGNAVATKAATDHGIKYVAK